jgi:hypothetical protein
MDRSELILKIVKKYVMDKYPMVEDVTITQGVERANSKYYDKPFLVYYTFHIIFPINRFTHPIYHTIYNEIISIKPYIFDRNEFIRGTQYHIDD